VLSYRYGAFGSMVSCLAYSGAQAAEMNEPDAFQFITPYKYRFIQTTNSKITHNSDKQ
jgi:hypothetical protein